MPPTKPVQPPPQAPTPSAPAAGPRTEGSAADWLSIEEIHPWVDNPRKITKRAVDKVSGLIQRFGFANPILARLANGEIIAGHTRYRAAKQLGMETVPVRLLDLSEEEAHELAIADNRSGEENTWDDALLAKQIRAMRETGRSLATLAFDDSEIDAIIKRAGSPVPLTEADVRLPVDPITQGARSTGEDEDVPDEGPRERRPQGKPVISYSIIFDTEDQQKRWYDFLRTLKTQYADASTVGERLERYFDDHADA